MKPGKIEIISPRKSGTPSIVVAAPHGEHDKFTGDIVRGINNNLGTPTVIVSDFVNPETKLRINVNRPTEGAGVDPKEETLTTASAKLYHRYLKSVLTACNHDFDLYVEIHGNEHKELAKRIEVATWNVTQKEARGLKSAYTETLSYCPYIADEKIKMWVEGVNPIEKRAWANKLFGVLPLSKKALHFELPIVLRADETLREETVDMLSELINKWANQSGPA